MLHLGKAEDGDGPGGMSVSGKMIRGCIYPGGRAGVTR